MPPPSESMLAALLAEKDWVRRLARGLASDAQRGDDLAQESWLAALRHPPRDASNLRAWFARLVRHKARDAARGDARRSQRELEHARVFGVVADEHGSEGGFEVEDGHAHRGRVGSALPCVDRSPAEAVERAELVRALVDAVMALHEPYKSALVLVYFEGLAPKDAAARLDLPDATLRSHVKRGLELVRARLDREHGGREVWLAGVAGLAFDALHRPSPLAPPAGTIAAATGVLIMKTKFAVAFILLLGLAWFAWSRFADERRAAPGRRVAPDPVELARQELARLPELPAARTPIVEAAPAAAPAASSATTGAIELELVFARDGRPAPHELVEVATWDAFLRPTFVDVVTDAEGRARIDGLRPGTVRVDPLRGGSARVDVAAGNVRRERVEIPLGVGVRGRVVTPDGKPAPGASIVVAFQGVRDAREVLRADEEGRFTLADLDAARAIGARKPGFAPSYLLKFDRLIDPSDTRELELVLRGVGGAVEGRVTDAQGAPVAGARVAIGPQRPYNVEAEPGTRATMMCAAAATTGADGRYRIEGIAPGPQQVFVQCARFPCSSTQVDVSANGVATLDLELLRGGALAGRVSLADGSPAPEVDVQIDPGSLHGARARTDALGWFRVDELAPGEHPIVAGTVALGRKQAKVRIVAGEEHSVEIALETGDVLAGRVVDENGAALVAWHVWATVAQDRYTAAELESVRTWPPGWNGVRTDADGRFVLTGLPRVAMRLEVRQPDLGGSLQPLAVLEPVVPAPQGAGDELVLRVAASSTPAAWIHGVVADAAGAPVGGAELLVVVASGGSGGVATRAVSEEKSGRFRIGPLPAGTYTLHGTAKGFLRAYLATAIVESAGERDVGVVRLKPAGRVIVRVRRRGGEAVDDARVHLVLDADRQLTTRIGDRFDSGPLEPGRYALYVEGEGPFDRAHPREVDVRANETAEVELELDALRR
ncbi:MAG: sigma-70 family RNA polymerase sigma factor [Planctomycetes bacterium]|nr:sigma-70 family RNA polymerase sigma factor [Planctomycetota bacterium]